MSKLSSIHAPQSFPRLTRASVDRALFLLAMLMLAAIVFTSHPDAPNLRQTAGFDQATGR